MDTDQLVGDIVSHWFELGQNRTTVVFACGVAHSIHLRDEFLKSGVQRRTHRRRHAEGRARCHLQRLAVGETDCCHELHGFDRGLGLPRGRMLILARPTKSMGLFRQMVGRVLRPAPGKVNAIVLDHSGAVFGMAYPKITSRGRSIARSQGVAPAHQARKLRDKKGLLECPACETSRFDWAASRAQIAGGSRNGRRVYCDRRRRARSRPGRQSEG